MNNKVGLLKNFSWTFVGSLIFAFSQWIILIVLAKFGNPEVVGQFSLGLAITAPFVLFANMQLRNIVATDSVEKYSFSQYFGTRLSIMFITLFILLVFLLFTNYSIYLSVVILLVGLSKVIESLSELTHGYFQQKERMDYAGKSLILKSISSIMAFSVVFIITRNLLFSLIALNVVWFFRLLLFDLKIVSKYTEVKPNYSNIKSILLLGLPLGFVSIINSLNTNIPRYFLENYYNIEQLGYFSAIAYILVVGNLFIRPVSLVTAPRIAQSFQVGNIKRYIRYTLLSLIIALILGVFIFIIIFIKGDFLLTIIYDNRYAKYSKIFNIMAIGSIIGFFTTFLNTSIVAAREFKIQPVINLITLSVTSLVSIMFVPTMGILGAAYVTLIAFITQFLLSLMLFLYILKKVKKKNEN